MGMFDYVRCKYPLPLAGAQDLEYQSKDTPAQCMDQYEIREDGTLWGEKYDVEDHSDPDAERGSLAAIFGCMTRVNQRWEQVPDLTGEVRFYDRRDDGGWIEFSAYFVRGHLKHLEQISPAEREPGTEPTR